jgi:CubicO group peptidase (beta-lactamase class C family)
MRIQCRLIVQGLLSSTLLLTGACGLLGSNDAPTQPTVTVASPTSIPPTESVATPVAIPAQPTATVGIVVTSTEAARVEAVSEIDFAPLIATIEQQMAAQQVPGLAVAIYQNGVQLFAQGFGVADVTENRAVTPATLFRIGSITKPLTTIGLMQLVEAGQVELDAPVVTYLPEFKVSDQITVRQLLSHSSGLGDAAIPYGRTDPAALHDYVASLTPASAFAPPGTLFSYSNPGFNTVGRIIEVVSGMPYADYMTTEVFPLLGMTHTTFRRDVALEQGLALGYYPSRDVPTPVDRDPDNGAEYPAGFAFSNVEDLSRLALFLLNDGALDGQQLLQPASVQAMKSPVIQVEPLEIAYGLGLLLRQRGEETIIGHHGNINGYAATLELLPSHGLAVIVLSNRNNFEVPRIARAVTELFVDRAEASPVAAQLPELDEAALAAYAGRYVMPNAMPTDLSGQEAEAMTVAMQDGRLTASLPGVTFELRPVGPDLFDLYVPQTVEPVTRLAFMRDASGAIAYMSFSLHALMRVE